MSKHNVKRWKLCALGAAALLALVPLAAELEHNQARAQQTQPSPTLRAASSFDNIRGKSARSMALFQEAGKVLTHPRCVNCHPAGDRPLQGELGQLHQPPVSRGEDGFGLVGMRCATCHQEQNYDPAGVPGAAKWHLAPREMAWEGKSLRQICEQLKDPKRNGGMSMEALVKHSAEDHLVGWGWQPGTGREPAPGDQETFGGLIRAWVDTGAVCPR
ncbi:hypothetical protein [Haliangium ochraceum]|uniref:Putative lipoprotein n=1 Tax=Haliangium ochraceum (strain DSM 14365 / JCM 11303 / SMP-2) TaxID=502025 RepID=D0LI72_HALO1|nr:hypothetical protein [Haliangium ochraceum]ACY16451.1 putative lipoprotein [Haliangium ochraceum DSM 14365]